MRYLILTLLSIALFSCADMPEEKRLPENGPAVETAPSDQVTPSANNGVATDGGLLKHSNRVPTSGSAAEGNLCKVLFDETMALFPLPDNPNGRFFEMNDTGGVYVVIVTAGNTRSTFMLAPHISDVELLSSIQAPECLSRHGNFFMRENSAGFFYDGSKYIKYHFDLSKTGKGFRGDLTWDAGKDYGIRVRYKKRLD